MGGCSGVYDPKMYDSMCYKRCEFCISVSPSLLLQLLVNQLSYLSCNSGFESSTDMISLLQFPAFNFNHIMQSWGIPLPVERTVI